MSYIKVNVQDLNISIKVPNKIGKVSYYLTDQKKLFMHLPSLFLRNRD